MEFLKPKGAGGAAKLKQQLLTVGDAAGNLHVYDVPQNLWRPLANERAIMSSFLEREIKVSMALHELSKEGEGGSCFTLNMVFITSPKCVGFFPFYRQSCVSHLTTRGHVVKAGAQLVFPRIFVHSDVTDSLAQRRPTPGPNHPGLTREVMIVSVNDMPPNDMKHGSWPLPSIPARTSNP